MSMQIPSFALMFFKKAFRSGGCWKIASAKLDNAFLEVYLCDRKIARMRL